MSRSWLGVCSVCLRRHDNIGYASSDRARFAWCCTECLYTRQKPDDPSTNIVRFFYNMSDKQTDTYERIAIERASEDAGEYLDTLGINSFDEIERFQWNKCCETFLMSYAKHMREMLQTGEAPF